MKRAKEYQAKTSGGIMLNANELYSNVSRNFQSEMMACIQQLDIQRYPDETHQELINAYASCMDLASDQILAGNGSDEMLGLAIGSFLGKGKTLCTLLPDFSMYDFYASMYEVNVVKYPCNEDGSFDPQAFIAFGQASHADMILLSNPNNPTGHALCTQELLRIVRAFPNLPVMIDEAYAEFNEESMLDQLATCSNLYVTRTLSKAYGLAGVRIGFLISNASNIRTLRPNVVPYNISSVAQAIGTIVLQHAKEYEGIIETIKTQRDIQYQRLHALSHLQVYPSHANYLYGRSAHKRAMLTALTRQGIHIRDYPDDTFRITIGSPEENDRLFQVVYEFDKEVLRCEKQKKNG